MHIIKIGGSIVNPTGKYDNKLIDEFIRFVKGKKEEFIFVVGGGKFCRKIQKAAKPILFRALRNKEEVSYGNDWLGISVTHINAHYVLERFKKKLGKKVHPELLLDPTRKVDSSARIFFAGGWKPGNSTDTDIMHFAQTFGAKSIYKVSNIAFVKNINPITLMRMKNKKALGDAKDLHSMTWRQMHTLIGDKWMPGLNTPFDGKAVKMGLGSGVKLHICNNAAFLHYAKTGQFQGTVIEG
jgi:uridylate kinase